MREMHFMLSYGAAVPSIKLLKKLKLLHILLPFQAFYMEKCEEWVCSQSLMLPLILFNVTFERNGNQILKPRIYFFLTLLLNLI